MPISICEICLHSPAQCVYNSFSSEVQTYALATTPFEPFSGPCEWVFDGLASLHEHWASSMYMYMYMYMCICILMYHLIAVTSRGVPCLTWPSTNRPSKCVDCVIMLVIFSLLGKCGPNYPMRKSHYATNSIVYVQHFVNVIVSVLICCLWGGAL